MSGYQPPGFATPIELDLSRNEGRPTVTSVGLDATTVARLTSRYPDTERLRSLVAARHDVPVGRVLVTAGGDDALFRCFLRNSGRVVATSPSFEMNARYAEQVGADLAEVDWWDGEFPLEDFLAVEADMAVLVSPNNPTGSVITTAELDKVAGTFPLVVLDAAYGDFADEDLTAAALGLPNVVVIRTLSKAYGLAGLRVGYLLGSEGIVGELGGFGSPYSLSGLSAALAADVLENQPGWPGEFAAVVGRERDRLRQDLSEMGVVTLPSQGNFILITGVDDGWVVAAAASLGVALRRFPTRSNLAGCVRVTLPGNEDDFDRLERTLATVLAPEALIFDMDGVLADVRQSYRAAIVATAATFGVTVSDSDIVEAKARGGASDDWDLTRRLCSVAGVDATFEEVKSRFEGIYHGVDGGPGLKVKEALLASPGILERLSARLPLAVVTARPREHAEEFLGRFDIGGLFDVVVAREDAPSKPDPAPVRLALERLGVGRAWMLGDTRDDIEAARGAGVVPIGVSVPGDDVKALAGAARVVGSIDEIEEVLDGTQG
jgi:histidinol-phosphate aminotransferase